MRFYLNIVGSLVAISLALGPAKSFAHETHFETEDRGSDSEDGPDEYQIGFPDSSEFSAGDFAAPEARMVPPERVLEQPIAPPKSQKPSVPPVFDLASTVFKAVVGPEEPAPPKTAAPVEKISAPESESRGLASASAPSLAAPGPRLSGGPDTDDLTRTALAAESKFRKEIATESAPVPETYGKILSALEKKVVKSDLAEETETSERKGKNAAHPTSRRRPASGLKPTRASY